MNMRMKILAAAIVVALAPATQAVNLHQYDGQVLLSPYYTARDGQETYLSIVNTTGDTKAIKVRFVEAMNSREVLDFNLYMSPYDVWTAAVQGTSKGAKIYTQDNSCTAPMIPKDGVEFRTFAFDGTLSDYPLDGGPIDADRTREGHIEIIEMGVANTANLGFWDRNKNGRADSTHDETGYPENCQGINDNWYYGDWVLGRTSTNPPTGGLFGNSVVIDVQKGTEVDVPISILTNFSEVELHYAPGTIDPNLSHANPAISLVLTADSQIIQDQWGTGIEAVSAAMMTETVVQEYTVNPSVFAETAWVVSMPTKHYHVDDRGGLNAFAGLAPFTEYYYDGESCDPVSSYIFNREEDAVNKNGIDFSPPPAATIDELCQETNVLNYNESDIFRSTLVAKTVETPFKNGWNTLTFAGKANEMTSKAGNTYQGLPAIGFMSTKLLNANVGVGAAYGASSPFRYKRTVSGGSAD